jgi:hypothetical protein
VELLPQVLRAEELHAPEIGMLGERHQVGDRVGDGLEPLRPQKLLGDDSVLLAGHLDLICETATTTYSVLTAALANKTTTIFSITDSTEPTRGGFAFIPKFGTPMDFWHRLGRNKATIVVGYVTVPGNIGRKRQILVVATFTQINSICGKIIYIFYTILHNVKKNVQKLMFSRRKRWISACA